MNYNYISIIKKRIIRIFIIIIIHVYCKALRHKARVVKLLIRSTGKKERFYALLNNVDSQNHHY